MLQPNNDRCFHHTMTGNAGKILLVFLFIFNFTDKSHAQVLQDQQVFDNIKKGVVYIYNFQFEEASEISVYLEKKCGECCTFLPFQGYGIILEKFSPDPRQQKLRYL